MKPQILLQYQVILTLLQHVLCFLYSKEEVCLVQKLKRKITTVITVSDFYFWFFFFAESDIGLYVGLGLTIAGLLTAGILLFIFRKEPVVQDILRVINSPFWLIAAVFMVIFWWFPQWIFIKLKKKFRYLLGRTGSPVQTVRIEMRDRRVGVGCPQFSLWTPPDR